MFNVAIFKLKDITKYLVGTLLLVIMIVLFARFFDLKKENKLKLLIPQSKLCLQSINSQIPAINSIKEKEENKEENKNKNYLKIAIRDRNISNK